MAKRRRRRELIESDEFHAQVVSLLRVRHADWTEWEETWLLDNAQRENDYIYSDNQWRVLHELVAYSKSYEEYAGYCVQELLQTVLLCRFDVDEDAQEFVETVRGWGATDLKLRQIRRLAAIARTFELIGKDEALDIAGRLPTHENIF
jgi:hypothetical protein